MNTTASNTLPFAVDSHEIANIMRRVADEELRPRFKMLNADEIQAKTSGEIVTIADGLAEEALMKAIKALYPHALVIGEECVCKDPSLLSYLQKTDEERPIFVIDPLDGTKNFANGESPYGMIIALIWRGQTQMGWLYDVCNNQMITTKRGEGTYLNGRRCQTVPQFSPDQIKGIIKEKLYHKPIRNKLVANLSKFAGYEWHGATVCHYIRLCLGMDQFGFFYGRVKPWDHAAGALAITESGGHVARLDGKSYSPNQYERSGLMVAASEENWHMIHDILFKNMALEDFLPPQDGQLPPKPDDCS